MVTPRMPTAETLRTNHFRNIGVHRAERLPISAQPPRRWPPAPPALQITRLHPRRPHRPAILGHPRCRRRRSHRLSIRAFSAADSSLLRCARHHACDPAGLRSPSSSLSMVSSLWLLSTRRIRSIRGGISSCRSLGFSLSHPTRNLQTVFSNGYCWMRSLSFIPRFSFVSNFSMHSCLDLRGNNTMLFSTPTAFSSLAVQRLGMCELSRTQRCQPVRFRSNSLVTLNTDDDVVRFSVDKPDARSGVQKRGKETPKKKKMSRKAKLNELKWYRLKAKKKMKSPNPEVRIRYKLEKAKRKEEWLIEKLRKYEIPRTLEPVHDPEILTEEERFYFKRTGEKKKNYVPVGRRGVFGGVVLNMHLHWKKHETVKVVCKPCRPGQVHEIAEELARLSKGTVIDIKANNIIIFYRGKNYVQPEVMSPPNTLSKQKALEKYRFEQSLEHTSQFIEKLEKELEEYHKHVALYTKHEEAFTNNNMGEEVTADSSTNTN